MKYIPIIVVSLILAILFIGPWQIPYGFRTAARIMPVKAWELVHYPNNSMAYRLYNNEMNGIVEQKLYQFDEDIVEMDFHLDELPDFTIPENFLVLDIRSNQLNQDRVGVLTELNEQRAELIKDQIGDKPETLKRLEEEVRLAEQSVVLLEKQLARQQQLLSENLVALADFERTENALLEARQKVIVSTRLFEESQAGAKPQQLDLLEARIKTLEATASFLDGKEALYAVFCPITGHWKRVRDLDGTEHLWVEDTSGIIVQVPVRERDLSLLTDSFQLVIPQASGDIVRTVTNWTNYGARSVIDNERVQWVQIRVDGIRNEWLEGMPVPCRIEAGSLNPVDYVKKAFQLKW